jgi:hypothetical protein
MSILYILMLYSEILAFADPAGPALPSQPLEIANLGLQACLSSANYPLHPAPTLQATVHLHYLQAKYQTAETTPPVQSAGLLHTSQF